MHAHRVEVFDGADDDEVAACVAHDFEFVLFPAEHAHLDQDFVHRAELRPRSAMRAQSSSL